MPSDQPSLAAVSAAPPPAAARSGRRFLWPLAMAALIFFASSREHLTVPGPQIPNEDKLAHGSVYGLFGLLIARAFYEERRGRRALLLGVLIASAYGVTDEFHQHFVPGRSVDVMDWLADTVGAGLGAAVYVYSTRIRNAFERPLGRGRAPSGPGSGAERAAAAR